MAQAPRDNNREPTILVWNEDTGAPEPLEVAVASGRVLLDVEVVTSSTPGAVSIKRDDNDVPVGCVVTDDSSGTPTPLIIDNRNGRLFIDLTVE